MLQYIPFIGDAIGRVFGNKEKREKYQADARSTVYNQFANEFGHSKTWWDSLIDGFNRLPRPFMTFGTIYIFYLSWTDPIKFLEGATALQAMPNEGWAIMGAVVTFWFAAKLPGDFGKMKLNKKASDIVKDMRTVREAREGYSATKRDPQEGIEWDERVKDRYKVDL